METYLEEPMSQTELPKEASLSTRQLERRRKYLNTTPTRYYLNCVWHISIAPDLFIYLIGCAFAALYQRHISQNVIANLWQTPRTERTPE